MSALRPFINISDMVLLRSEGRNGSVATEVRYPQHVRSSRNCWHESRHRRRTFWAQEQTSPV